MIRKIMLNPRRGFGKIRVGIYRKGAFFVYTLDEDYMLAQFKSLLSVDSTTGQFREIQEHLVSETVALGFPVDTPHKGGVIASLGGEGNCLAVTAHVDDIGLMVRHINADGTLNVFPVGGLYPFCCVTENVRVHTRDGKVFTGAVCRTPNSVHVTEEELRAAPGDFRKNVCVVLDENVKCAAGHDVRHACIGPGALNSHGYERTHMDGLRNTYALLMEYITAKA